MKWRAKFCIASTAFWAVSLAQASGLSTTFVDVVVEQANVGKTYEAHGPEGKGLIIKNLGDAPISVSVQALEPTPAQLRPGARSLPDLSWVHFDPPTVSVPPHGEKEVKVAVQVPHRRKFRNTLYQVMVWSRGETVHMQGISMNAALLSCLRIHTSP